MVIIYFSTFMMMNITRVLYFHDDGATSQLWSFMVPEIGNLHDMINFFTTWDENNGVDMASYSIHLMECNVSKNNITF